MANAHTHKVKQGVGKKGPQKTKVAPKKAVAKRRVSGTKTIAYTSLAPGVRVSQTPGM